jgi:hypothetical protein
MRAVPESSFTVILSPDASGKLLLSKQITNLEFMREFHIKRLFATDILPQF